MGIALCNVIEPDATSATTTDVVVELLWSIAVTSNPINRPVKGLEVASKMVSVAFLPMCCREDVIRSSANRKRRNAPRIEIVIRTLSRVVVFDSVI
jgi:hypothetical protein